MTLAQVPIKNSLDAKTSYRVEMNDLRGGRVKHAKMPSEDFLCNVTLSYESSGHAFGVVI
jgi:hypothetical protein